MKYLKPELPIAIALIVLGLGFALEHGAVEHGGITLWGLLLVILAAIIGVAFRIAHHALRRVHRTGDDGIDLTKNENGSRKKCTLQ